ncbi:ABC transporter permease [Malaciobacter halophilus]|uniref:ABC transporter permease n=1 Tax=Malaciobacter halophilus TaxID=197482 RepID=A0A2N1J5L9_9BACT|nr:iron ABC transporter permease [Malaciobacter halophilus]AXH09230.1 iron siderophore ABC transporter, permease protein [Malaciobacter halophilus]PKI81865.1 ABC transporter permease [Malaciobacter halophilus]
MYTKQLYSKKRLLIAIFLLFITISLIWLSLISGNNGVVFSDTFKLLEANGSFSIIVFEIRVPRTLAAFVVGASLGLSGAMMQAVLKNPLASPFTLGISQASAFGASFAIIVFQSYSSASSYEASFITALFAFASSMINTFLIVSLGKRANMSPESLILFGVALGAFFSAFTMLLQYFADDIDAAATLFWTFGDLSKASMNTILSIGLVLLICLFFYFKIFWKFDALMLGEDSAKSLGINTQNLRLGSMIVASFLSAISVCFFGIIGFVGLIAPHIVRLFIGSSHKYVLPLSAISGAILLLLADIVSRTILLPITIPVGIITSMLGAPLFLYFLYKRSSKC